SFLVSSGGQLTKLVFAAIHLTCQGEDLSWSLDLGAASYVVRRDGFFDVDGSGTGTVSGSAASYHAVVAGHLQRGVASGSVKLDVEVPATATACTTPQLSWTAAAAILNQP